MNDSLKEKLRALRIMYLDERCTKGERNNAKTLYNRMLSKYGLLDTDIVEVVEEKETHWFKPRGVYEKKLLHQIVAKVIEPEKLNQYYMNRVVRTEIGYDLTENQAIQVKAKFAALKKVLKKEFEYCYHGFIQANELGLNPTGDEPEPSQKDLEELQRMLDYFSVMKKTVVPETNPQRLLK